MRYEHRGIAENRLVAVLDELAWDHGFVEAALVTNEVDLAGRWDARFRRGEAETAFDFLVELDVVRSLRSSRLSPYRLGRLPCSSEVLLEAAELGIFEADLAERLGMPIRGTADPRWAWKTGEHGVMEALCAATPVASKVR